MHAHHAMTSQMVRLHAPADRAHDACMLQTASTDLAPHDDATQALTSTASVLLQLTQVTGQASSAADKTSGKAPSSNQGMPAADGTDSAKSSQAQHCQAALMTGARTGGFLPPTDLASVGHGDQEGGLGGA